MKNAEEESKSQKFFAELAHSIRAPAYGEKQRAWMIELLKLAQGAGIYTPTPEAKT